METLKTLKIKRFILIIVLGFIIMFILPLDELFFVKYLRKETWESMQTDIVYYLIPFLIILCHQLKNGSGLIDFLRFKKFKISDIILANLGTLLLATGLMGLAVFCIIGLSDINEPIVSNNSQIGLTFYDFCVVAVIAPFFEELIFRGYLLERMGEKWGKLKAIFITAFLFGVIHSVNFISAFLIGILFAIIRYKYNSLFPIIVAHMINNIFVNILKNIIFSKSSGSTDFNSQILFQKVWLLLIILIIMVLFGSFLYWTFLKKNKDILKKIKSE